MNDIKFPAPSLPDQFPKNYIAILIPIQDDDKHKAEEGFFNPDSEKFAYSVCRDDAYEFKDFLAKFEVSLVVKSE